MTHTAGVLLEDIQGVLLTFVRGLSGRALKLHEGDAVYTDSETWAGKIHPKQALDQYRQKMGIPAKVVVVGMTATEFSIADPNDAGMMDVVGFDTAAPNLIRDFAVS